MVKGLVGAGAAAVINDYGVTIDGRDPSAEPATQLAAEITADVQARSVVVAGAIEGDISAQEAVAIRAGARVSGAIRGSSISIEEGATVNGRIDADFELPPELGGKGSR